MKVKVYTRKCVVNFFRSADFGKEFEALGVYSRFNEVIKVDPKTYLFRYLIGVRNSVF